MGQYNKHIVKAIQVLLDNFIIYNRFFDVRNNLTYEQMYILMQWSDGVTLTDFLSDYGYSRSAGIQIVDKLIENKYLRKEVCKDDKRMKAIYRTELGNAYSNKIQKIYDIEVEKLLSDLTINDEKGILKFLTRINNKTEV